MGRPRTPVGIYGVIKTQQIGVQPPVWEARARFRMAKGGFKRLRKRGATKTAAENALKKKITQLSEEVTGKSISGETRFAHIADLWLAEIEREVRLGTTAPNTYSTYRGRVKNWAKPKLGELQAVEVTVTAVDEVIKAAQDQVSYHTAKSVKVVLGVRHGAMKVNPVRSAARLSMGEAKEGVALEVAQRIDLLDKLEGHGKELTRDARGHDLGPRAQVWRQARPDPQEHGRRARDSHDRKGGHGVMGVRTMVHEWSINVLDSGRLQSTVADSNRRSGDL